VASDGPGTGTVHALPPGAFCDGVPGSTQTCTHAFDAPTQVTLTAVPNGLAVFAGWSGACSGTGPCTVDVAAREFVRAAFIGPYRLAVRGVDPAFDPPGVECGDTVGPCAWQRAGTTVTLRYEVHVFETVDWVPEPRPTEPEPPCGQSSCVVVMDRARFLHALVHETPFPNPISISPDNGRMYQAFGAVYLFPQVTQLQYPPLPLHYSWFDETTGQYLGDAPPPIAPPLAVGLHYITLFVFDDAEPTSNSAFARYELFVRDP